MDVLQTPVRFYPYIGGVESYVYDLSKHLVQLGHNVNVICADTETHTDQQVDINGVEVTRLQSVGKVANTNITPSLVTTLYREAKSADIIHTHLPTPWSADISAFISYVTDTPLIVTYHNDIVGEGISDIIAHAYNNSVLPVTLRSSDQIIVTQQDYVGHSRHLRPYRDKVSVIRNGVDIDQFKPVEVGRSRQQQLGFDEDRQNLFFLSVLDGHHEYKGLDVLLEAISILNSRDKKVPKLIIGGDGPARSKYEKQANSLGVSSHVEFIGRVSDNDLIAYYSTADLFVLPSTSSDQEGFGLVLLEALSCETPVIATDVVGVSDKIASHNIGELVPQNDAAKLAATIRRCTNDAVFNTDQCRKICVEEYSWRSSAREMEQIYLRFAK